MPNKEVSEVERSINQLSQKALEAEGFCLLSATQSGDRQKTYLIMNGKLYLPEVIKGLEEMVKALRHKHRTTRLLKTRKKALRIWELVKRNLLAKA